MKIEHNKPSHRSHDSHKRFGNTWAKATHAAWMIPRNIIAEEQRSSLNVIPHENGKSF